MAKKKVLKLFIYLGLLVFIGFGLIGLYFFVFLNYELRKSQPTEEIEEFVFIAPVFEPDTFVNLNLTYETSGFENIDSLFDNFEKFQRNYSDDSLSIFSFRGNAWRNAPQLGKIKSKPKDIEKKWTFYTDFDSTTTNLGQWGGGAGWTGQALLIRWDSEQKRKLGIVNQEFLANPDAYEAIIGSLCGNIYFLDAETGKPTREHLSIGNPIKGTVAVDPRKNGLLYVGQGIKHGERFGAYIFDMFSQKEIKFISGYDSFAYRKWCSFDSNPLIDKNSGTVFWAGENGLIYRFVINENNEIKNLVKLRYKHDKLFRQGIESSMAVIDNYGFVADNSGSILCIDLRNMKILWNIDNYDDSDATIMIDEENPGEFFLYSGNEVDNRPSPDTSHFRKICAKTGKEQWRVTRVCDGSMLDEKVNSGGILASPVLGKHNGKDLVFCIFARSDKQNRSDLVAVNKYTGKEKYSITLDDYSWSSPADFYDEKGNMYLFFTDVSGTIYVIYALTGEILIKEYTDYCFEASPVVLNNNVIIASRGRSIICYEIK